MYRHQEENIRPRACSLKLFTFAINKHSENSLIPAKNNPPYIAHSSVAKKKSLKTLTPGWSRESTVAAGFHHFLQVLSVPEISASRSRDSRFLSTRHESDKAGNRV
jgi:hypothetical protein